MNKKNVLLIILGIIAVFLIGFITVWAVTDLPRLIPPPKAKISETPFAGTVNGCKGLSMTIDPDSVTPTSATLTLYNETGYKLSSGHPYGLDIHVLREGQWYPVNRRTDKRAVTYVPSIAIEYPADQFPCVEPVSWKAFLGRLEPGHYRLVWKFYIHENSDIWPFPTVDLSAEFDVK